MNCLFVKFKSSVDFQNKDQILQTLEKYGAICDCQAGRDVLLFIYKYYVLKTNFEKHL